MVAPSKATGVATGAPTLTADDAHGKKAWPLADIYTRTFNAFAGPETFRHGSNYPTYHRAGLIAVWNAALSAQAVAQATNAPPAPELREAAISVLLGAAPAGASKEAVGAPVEPLPLTYLLVAMDDEGQAHLTECSGRGAVVDAVVVAVFGEPTLDQDAREECAGITDELIEAGIFRFEGDPPLHLFRLDPSLAGEKK